MNSDPTTDKAQQVVVCRTCEGHYRQTKERVAAKAQLVQHKPAA
ncbi:hypothetical protein [Hydrogenophaga defluvii]